jgi:cell division protein FtsQ
VVKQVRNRRKPVNREETRIAWSELGKLFVSAAVVVLCIFTARMIDDVSIESIHVSSKLDRVSKQQVSEVVKRYELDGFFTLRLKEFENDLNDLGWVYRANIKRQWPYKLVIEIEEQTPVFRWNQDQLLNKYAQVFSAKHDEDFADKPLLRGEQGREQVLAQLYQKFNHQFHNLGITIDSLEEDARYDKVMHLNNGVTINMGRDNVDLQMQRCLKMFALLNQEERSAIATIDLRHSHGLAISWSA